MKILGLLPMIIAAIVLNIRAWQTRETGDMVNPNFWVVGAVTIDTVIILIGFFWAITPD